MPKPLPPKIVKSEGISSKTRIVEVRGDRVLLDRDVAKLFGTEARKLNQQVKRNEARFAGFAFRLEWEEFEALRSQNVILPEDWTKVTYPPLAFTEHGVVMAATLLKTDEAIAATRMIVRTFVDARREAWEKEMEKSGQSGVRPGC